MQCLSSRIAGGHGQNLPRPVALESLDVPATAACPQVEQPDAVLVHPDCRGSVENLSDKGVVLGDHHGTSIHKSAGGSRGIPKKVSVDRHALPVYHRGMSIRCGHCKSRHVYVSDVRDCAYDEAAAQAEYEAEQAAERAAERFWEEGPNGPADDPHERWLWAMEDQAKDIREAAHLMSAPTWVWTDR